MSALVNPDDIHRRRAMDQRECDLAVRKHELFVLGRAGGQRANFSYRNLTGLNLACKNLSEADFTGAIMVECDLSGTNLQRALLFCANLTKAKMVRANLTRADMRGAVLKGADLTAAELFNADLREGAIFTKRMASDLQGVTVDTDPTDMSRAKMVNANLSQANMSGAVAMMVDFTDAILKGANLAKANLKNATLEGADLEGADLSRADLRGAILRNANLYGATMIAADRTGCDETGALTDLPRGKPMTMLKESLHTLVRDHGAWIETGGASGHLLDISGFDLRDIEWPDHVLLTSMKAKDACIAHAKFSGAWLQASLFEGADLRGADFRTSDLRGANLKGANLVRANFESCNLAPMVVASGKSLVTRLDGAILRHARFQRCQLVQTSFRNADLRWATIVDSDTSGGDFEGAVGLQLLARVDHPPPEPPKG